MVIEIAMFMLAALSSAGMTDQILVCMRGRGIWTVTAEQGNAGTHSVSSWRWLMLGCVGMLWVCSESGQPKISLPFLVIPIAQNLIVVWMLVLMLLLPPRRRAWEKAAALVVILLTGSSPVTVPLAAEFLERHQHLRDFLPFLATGVLSFSGRLHQLWVMRKSADYGRLPLSEALITTVESFMWMINGIVQERPAAAIACLLVTLADALRSVYLARNDKKRREFANGCLCRALRRFVLRSS